MKIKKTSGIISALFIAATILMGSQHAAAQETKAEKEISQINTGFIAAVNGQDIKGILTEYSSEVKSVNPDGSVNDYQEISDGLTKAFQYVKSLKYTKTKEEFKVLSKSLVLCTWIGTVEIELKSGQKMTNYPHVASLLFSKTGNTWKIIYEHASEAPPKMESPGKF